MKILRGEKQKKNLKTQTLAPFTVASNSAWNTADAAKPKAQSCKVSIQKDAGMRKNFLWVTISFMSCELFPLLNNS
jgi:hypothetical protein